MIDAAVSAARKQAVDADDRQRRGQSSASQMRAGSRNQKRSLIAKTPSRPRFATKRRPRRPPETSRRTRDLRDGLFAAREPHDAPAGNCRETPIADRRCAATARRRCSPRRCRSASGRNPMPSIQFTAPRNPATNRVRGRKYISSRRPDLLDAAGVHHRDLVGHRQRFFLVMGDEQECDPDAPLQRLQLRAHLLPQLRIERRERLIEQQDVGLQHQDAPAPRAAARRRKAAKDNAPPSRLTRTSSSASSTLRAMSGGATSAAIRIRRCPAPSGAGTARSSETPC